MFKRFQQRFDARNDEQGAALLSVVLASVLVLLALAAMSHSMMTTITNTALTTASVRTLSAAESGRDVALASVLTQRECDPTGEDEEVGFEYEIYGSDFAVQAPTADNLYGAHAGCPETGDRYLLIKATGKDDKGNSREVVSVYRWSDENGEGAFDADADVRAMPELISREER